MSAANMQITFYIGDAFGEKLTKYTSLEKGFL
jgi:hypothetical protein